jgi:hypothetical protein
MGLKRLAQDKATSARENGLNSGETLITRGWVRSACFEIKQKKGGEKELEVIGHG